MASDLKLNIRAGRVADALAADAEALGCAVTTVAGARVIDAGVKQPGSLDAGVMLARICLADLATVSLVPSTVNGISLPGIAVTVNRPVAACMASQYAGWQITVGKYFAMGSGPMRAAYGKEELFNDIGCRETPSPPESVVGVLETGKLPPDEAVQLIVSKCNVPADRLTLAVARTASLAGSVQVVARSVETAMHKLHTLKFDLHRVVSGFGVAPLCPVAKDDMAAIGRTNDAVLYGAQVTLYVNGDDDSLAAVGPQLPSSASKDYGRPFGDIFKGYGYDFYKIDPLLFSPAAVTLQNIQTGRSFTFGAVNAQVLAQSFFA